MFKLWQQNNISLTFEIWVMLLDSSILPSRTQIIVKILSVLPSECFTHLMFPSHNQCQLRPVSGTTGALWSHLAGLPSAGRYRLWPLVHTAARVIFFRTSSNHISPCSKASEEPQFLHFLLYLPFHPSFVSYVSSFFLFPIYPSPPLSY